MTRAEVCGRIAGIGILPAIRVSSEDSATFAVEAVNQAGIPLAEVTMNEYPPTRSFRASAHILKPDSRLRPGMNGSMDIVVNRIPHAISIPARALFTKAGSPVVYVGHAGAYKPVEVKVEARNPDEVAISGIPAGSTVAMVDIEKRGAKK